MRSVREQQPGRFTIGLLLTLGFVSAAGSLSTDLYLPAFPDLARSFEVTPAVVQLTLTAFMVGAACGQLIIGSLSDALGRRRTLLAGLSVFVLAGVAAALSPSIEVLIAIRALQGLAGAAGVVLSRAIIADALPPREAARALGGLFMMIGIGPAVASPLGAALTELGGWRAALWGLAIIAAAMLFVSVLNVPETLPVAARHPFRVGTLAANIGRLLAQPTFRGYVLAMSTGYTAMMAYIASSSFIAQDVLGLQPIGYSLTFAAGALAFMVCAWVSGRLVGRIGGVRVLRLGQVLQLAAAFTALICALTGALTLWTWLPLVMLLCGGTGVIMPTASGLALARAAGVAGAGSALIGFTQFAFGAIGTPLGGMLGTHTAVPATLAMTGFAVCGLVAGWFASRAAAGEGRARSRG